MSVRLPIAALLAGLMVLLWARATEAAPCGRPDVDVTFPPGAASGVPTNAMLAAHYASPALYANEPVTLTDPTGAALDVTVSYDEADSMLRATPVQPLAAGPHEVVWPGLRGVSASGGVGRGRTTDFNVSGLADATPPSFAGLSAVEWDLARDRDPCLDRLDDRFVFQLRVGPGSDDAGTESLSLLVFETHDPGAPHQGEPSRVGVQAWPSHGVVEIRRSAQHAGRTCFAAVLQDLVGNVSGGGEREVCVKTQAPPFFDGCSVGSAQLRSRSSALGSALGLLGLAWLRRRGRGAHARPTALT